MSSHLLKSGNSSRTIRERKMIQLGKAAGSTVKIGTTQSKIEYLTIVTKMLTIKKRTTQGRQPNRVVRALDLKFGIRRFKSRSDHLAGVVSR